MLQSEAIAEYKGIRDMIVQCGALFNERAADGDKLPPAGHVLWNSRTAWLSIYYGLDNAFSAFSKAEFSAATAALV